MHESMSILIVEDERLISMMLCRLLETAGFAVCGVAPNLLEAYDILENRSPDFVLIDIHLEGDDNGIVLGRRLRKEAKTPFAYVSAYSDRSTYDAAMETKPVAFLQKPISPQALKTILNEYHNGLHHTPR
ncbi:MAG TPA: response regulator [bacterium]|nr:response regulator [bacterium]